MKAIFVIFLTLLIGSAFAQNNAPATMNKILQQMESPAEDMLDAIDAKDSKKLTNLFLDLKQNMQELNQINAREKYSSMVNQERTKEIAIENSWFNLISLEMKEMDDLPALSYVVNQFSGELVILTHFKHAYDKDTAWMDYLGRELLLLSKSDDSGLIKTRKIDLQKTWQQVRPALTKNKKNNSLITKIDDLVTHIMMTTDSKNLESQAIKELNLVDEIENALQID